MQNKPNRGALFKNTNKASNTHPDYRGEVDVDGKPYWFSAWVKIPKDGGEKYLSVSVQVKQPKEPVKAYDVGEIDDGIPF